MRLGRRVGWLAAAVCASLGFAYSVIAQTRNDVAPYGCWSMADQVERLACFDMALGPPVTVKSDPAYDDLEVASCAETGKPTPPPR